MAREKRDKRNLARSSSVRSTGAATRTGRASNSKFNVVVYVPAQHGFIARRLNKADEADDLQ